MARNTFSGAVLLLLTLMPAESLAGHQVGQRVRVTVAEGPALIGRVIGLQEGGFHLYLVDRRGSQRVGYADVLRVEQSLGMRRYGWLGLGIGACAGAILLGSAAQRGDDSDPVWGFTPRPGAAIVAGSLLGGLAGAVVGSLIQTERWETIEWDLGGGVTPGLLAGVRPGLHGQLGLLLGGRLRL